MSDRGTDCWREKDDRRWRIGSDAEIAWIRDSTQISPGITSAIPPVFEAYATVELPGTGEHDQLAWLEDPERHDAAVLAVLGGHTAVQPWWLGYLQTGASDVIFYDVPKVSLFPTHDYVLIEAGPAQAAVWREAWDRWKGALPDLMFPADHSWLVSTLWDDDWTCVGGPQQLVDSLVAHPDLGHRVRRVDVRDEDVTPPGHVSI
ncbi:MAG: hypothetical protein ACXVSL_14395 [Solirubrobacteraceae bacterium]